MAEVIVCIFIQYSINWPALSVWVFITQLAEHCSANAEATCSNPVEAPKNIFFFFFSFFRATSQLLKLRFNCEPHIHFFLYSRSSNNFIRCIFIVFNFDKFLAFATFIL